MNTTNNQASGVVEVCPDCDIADCFHIRARRAAPPVEVASDWQAKRELMDKLDARDAGAPPVVQPAAWSYTNSVGKTFFSHTDPATWHPHDREGFSNFRAMAYIGDVSMQPASPATGMAPLGAPNPHDIADVIRSTGEPASPAVEVAGDSAAYLIYYDDRDRTPEIIIGTKVARARFKAISVSWNAHLFGKLESNSRDERWANCTLATPAAAAFSTEPDMRAICEALGFDPTNHHNAAVCPYCRPPTTVRLPEMPDLRAAPAVRHGFAKCLDQVLELNADRAPAVACEHEWRAFYTGPVHTHQICAKCDTRLLAEVTAAADLQPRVQPWLIECFGPMIAGDREERNHRFIEEALELVQACGCSASEAHQLVDYVFSRPVGEKGQEVGGTMITLAALCLANHLDMHAEGERELARITQPEMVLKIRAKQAAKPKHSPLPGPATVFDDSPLETSDGNAR